MSAPWETRLSQKSKHSLLHLDLWKEEMMNASYRLSTHLKTRLTDLEEAGRKGRKIIGYPDEE
jgi:hypothetical protein